MSSRKLYASIVFVLVCLSALELGLRGLPLMEAQVEMGEYEKAQLEMFRQNAQLLTTLATAVMGAMAGLLLKRDKSDTIPASERSRIIFSIASAALSVYFGHVASGQVLFMLHARFFNMYYPGIWLSSQLQFVAFICSAVALADTSYRMMTRDEAHA